MKTLKNYVFRDEYILSEKESCAMQPKIKGKVNLSKDMDTDGVDRRLIKIQIEH